MVEDTHRNTDSIRQLMRRLNTIVYHFKDKEGHFRTYTMPAKDYISAYDIKQKALEFEKNTSYDDFIKNRDKSIKEHYDMFDDIKIVEGGDIL